MQCEYCQAEFKTKGNLKNHQLNAKYCLELRNNKSENWKCDFCLKTLASKQSLHQHYEKCKVNAKKFLETELEFERLKLKEQMYIEQIQNLENKVNEFREQNQNLQNQLREFTTLVIEKTTNNQTSNTINYNQNNNSNNQQNNIKNIDNRTVNMVPFNLTPEGIRETLESKFNEKYLMRGQKGVAEFMVENVLISGENEDKKYLMKCTDPSRRMFITLDDQGRVTKDVNADNLTKMISGPVKEVSHKLFQEIQDRFFTMYESISNELEEGDKEKEDLSLENERLDHATNKVCEISRLKNNNTEFVKNLISPLSVS